MDKLPYAYLVLSRSGSGVCSETPYSYDFFLHARDFLGTLEGHSLFVPLSALSRKIQSLLFPLSLLRGQLSAVLILDSTLHTRPVFYLDL